MRDAAEPRNAPLGWSGQWDRREAERRVRAGAVAFSLWLRRHGLPRSQAASRLGLRPATLGTWERAWKRPGRLVSPILGRRRRGLDLFWRLRLREYFLVEGPMVGLDRLKRVFEDVPRSDLRQALAAYRGDWHEENAVVTEELLWLVPGTVWAADFTDTPVPVDGQYQKLLVVRDLASQAVLLALPAAQAEARLASEALEMLFVACGPPLLLKTDNGSPFIAIEFRKLLINKHVASLLSPAATPRYNGAVEAGMGSLKTRIFYHAAACGRPQRWTSDDVEAAREQINQATYPWGVREPTPWQRWQGRPPITEDDRRRLMDAIAEAIRQRLEREGLDETELLPMPTRAALVRAAIRRALIGLGYLEVRRRRITPPFKSPLRHNIT
jgi:transposase InsO family protein